MEAASIMTMAQIRGELRYDEPMSRHLSWRAGGKAKCYFVPADLDDLSNMLASLPADEKILWIGLGSNTLVRDAGFNGTVIALQRVLNELKRLDNNRVYAGAGVTGSKLARFCAKENLVGAGFFAGIPGLVGGALAMNAGAFGGETWQHVVSVETIDRKGQRHKRNADEYEIGYRSVKGPADEWFTAAIFQFEQGDSSKAAQDIKQLLAKRAETQPMGTASCGSVFTNPENDHAARLIEACGLKGCRIGGAVVSEKHANFIINDNNASAEDIEALIKHVQKAVFEQQGVELHTEVKIVGDAA
ncbi:MAG: UDP-N-acetylmuramate dehydrogenase [Gammaproteobacteria bacterium]|jgi:UDP-N-acetylmuramate dehydrogenase